MSNPLFGMLGGQGPSNPMMMLVQRFQQFKQGFNGNANQQIQQLMGAGKVNQQQYNQAVQMARQFGQMFGMR